MITVWLGVVALGVLAILAVVLRMAADLRVIRDEIRQAYYFPGNTAFHLPHLPKHTRHLEHVPEDGFFAVWEWRDGAWRLLSDKVPSGADHGPHPAYPGSYEGETLKLWVPRRQP